MNWASLIGLFVGARLFGLWGGLGGFLLGHLLSSLSFKAYISKAFVRYLFKRLEAHQRYSYSSYSTAYSSEAPLNEDYRFLGIESTVSDTELKQHYRRLMNQHHPDKVLARGLPSSQLSAAKERTQAIRAAYDRIRAERGLG